MSDPLGTAVRRLSIHIGGISPSQPTDSGPWAGLLFIVQQRCHRASRLGLTIHHGTEANLNIEHTTHKFINFVAEANVTMAVHTGNDRSVTVRMSGNSRPPVRDGSEPERVVSVLFGNGIEEWRRGWRRLAGGSPGREAIISAGDRTRGTTAATTQVTPNGRVAYTVLGAPADTTRILDTVSDHVESVDDERVRVIVDDVGPLISDRGVDAVSQLVEGIRELLTDRPGGIVIGCSFSSEIVSALASVFDLADTVENTEPLTVETLARFRQDDPTTFGYLRRHWPEAQVGIEACDRNYPQSKQVHAVLSDPETTPRTLGATLSGLVTFDVLDTWSETVGPTRYDLTAYDPERMWVVGTAFASAVDGSNAPTDD